MVQLVVLWRPESVGGGGLAVKVLLQTKKNLIFFVAATRNQSGAVTLPEPFD
jgi:hypothetical protein